MIIDHKIETDFFQNVLTRINKVMKAKDTKLLILAPSYDNYMCSTVLEQYIRAEFASSPIHEVNLVCASYSMGKLAKHQLEDLAIILGAKVINQDLAATLTESIVNGNVDAVIDKILGDPKYKLYQLIGFAKSALLSCDSGAIFQPNDLEKNNRYQEAIRSAERELKNVIAQTDFEKKSYASKIYEANARVLQLKMRNYIYYIGADSDLQKQIIWDAVEDVIKCVRSAIKTGIVPGCQITIASCCSDAIRDISEKYSQNGKTPTFDDFSANDKLRYSIITMIGDSVEDVYRQILHGPEGMGIIKTLDRWEHTANTEEAVKAIQSEALRKTNEIIRESYDKKQVFDLETLEFNPGIVTSAETDMMVLAAASELVKILISGNQCIYRDAELNDVHDTQVKIPG